MYEMFTGRVPFVADTYMGVLTQHMFVKPVPPSQVSEGGDGRGGLGCTRRRHPARARKKPEQRYGTMQELAAAIERVSSFQPDGSLRVAPSAAEAVVPSRPVFAMANALEPATREEANAPIVTRTSARLRRARARAWLTYGGIALGVAAVALGAIRLLQQAPHRSPARSARSPCRDRSGLRGERRHRDGDGGAPRACPHACPRIAAETAKNAPLPPPPLQAPVRLPPFRLPRCPPPRRVPAEEGARREPDAGRFR